MTYIIKIKDNKTFLDGEPCVFCDKPETYCPEIDECVDIIKLNSKEIVRCKIQGWKCDIETKEVFLFANQIK